MYLLHQFDAVCFDCRLVRESAKFVFLFFFIIIIFYFTYAFQDECLLYFKLLANMWKKVLALAR